MTTITPTPATKLIELLGKKFMSEWAVPDVADHLRTVWVLAKQEDPRWKYYLRLWKSEAPKELHPAVDVILHHAIHTETAPLLGVTEDGMYRNPTTEEIFKVQWNLQRTRLYAKRLVMSETGDPAQPWQAEFAYSPGVVAKLRPEMKMTLEDARKFGALYGTCCSCGRTLTDEKSIAAGIGPVCASKF